MNIILLSGGSGKRLWPLSNDIRSKQFVKMFQNDQGEYESMVQRVYRQIKQVDPDASITIATSKKQVSTIHHQLGDKVSVCVEPARRDTFPAITLAAAYLCSEKHVDESECVLVMPVDPYVDEGYFQSLKKLYTLAQSEVYHLNLMGVEPTYPSEKYGYIIPKTKEPISTVASFREKPDAKTAEHYIAQGALWNCGVFAFRLGYLLEIAHRFISFDSYRDIYDRYETLEKISFDYAVVEKESSIGCLRYAGEWKDVGSWNIFSEVMSENAIGDVRLNPVCQNTHVINELDIPVLCMGLKDMIVAASSDGILIADKEQSSYIKPFVDAMNSEARYAEKSWGSYKVMDVENQSLIIKVTLMPGHQMHYHSHAHRDEIWNVVSGSGKAVLDGQVRSLNPGDVVRMPAGCKHTAMADTELTMIEVQLGSDIRVEDKEKYEQ